MQTYDVIVNRLPVLTWNRLGMNKSTVSGLSLMQGLQPVCSGGKVQPAAGVQTMETGCGQELSDLLERSGAAPLAVLGREEEPALLRFAFQAGAARGSRIVLQIPRGQSAVVMMDFAAPAEACGQGAVQTTILLEEGAELHLVQVQRLGRDFTFLNDIGAVCQKNARLKLTQLVLSGQKSYYGCAIRLEGDRSSFDAAVGYGLSGQEKLDMNYVVRHLGRQTTSNIHAGGSLRDTSAKLFRGTIDFVNGCAGSVGGELEEVLLIDDNCINQTIPLILCAEEDVEGNHGASIGKPDEQTLFYLESRGIPEEEAYALLIRAKLDAVAGRIPDPDFRQEVFSAIKGGEQDD